jgi:hypothetical protein
LTAILASFTFSVLTTQEGIVAKRERVGDLGPKQLAWCRENITYQGNKIFAMCQAGVADLQRSILENRLKMTGSETKLEDRE